MFGGQITNGTMETSFMIPIACTVLLVGFACALASRSEAARGAVSKVTQPEVKPLVPPAVPSTAAGKPAVGVGALGKHCACPLTNCVNGDASWCEVYCSSGEAPLCSCDGYCGSDGNARAFNRCACQ